MRGQSTVEFAFRLPAYVRKAHSAHVFLPYLLEDETRIRILCEDLEAISKNVAQLGSHTVESTHSSSLRIIKVGASVHHAEGARNIPRLPVLHEMDRNTAAVVH